MGRVWPCGAQIWRRWLADSAESGQSLVEYGLVIALMAIVVVVALVSVGSELNNVFNNIVSQLAP